MNKRNRDLSNMLEPRRKSIKYCDDQNLSCIFCRSQFATGGLLTRHISEHTGEKLLTCVVCKKIFPLESELVIHMCGGESSQDHQGQTEERIPASKQFSCSQCEAGFSRSEDLNLHLQLHTRENLYSCSVCKASCSDKDALLQHMRIHTRQTQFICHICKKDFTWRRHLTKHMEVHKNGKKIFHCSACSAKYSTYYQLSKHKVVHQSKENPHIQIAENREEQEQVEMQKEVKQKDPEPPQIKEEEEEAEITKFSFSPVPLKTEEDEKPQLLQLHHSQTEENKEILGEPDENEKTSVFSGPEVDDSDLWKPKRKLESGSNSESDSGRNLSSCSDNKVTESLQPESDDSVDSDFFKDYKKPQSNLNSLQQETTEKEAKCISYSKPYSCAQCSKVFRSNFYLKSHMKQHINRFACSVCGHRSNTSYCLKVHMRTHTGEKPFSCSFCGKKYTNSSSLRAHVTLHDADRKYSCDECKKSFAFYTELKYHQCVGGSSDERKYEEDSDINLKRHSLYNVTK